MKVYGPYTRKDGRKHIILYDGINRTTISYPKYLMEQHLGRKLEDWETVDHINEDFTDDRIENLQILSRADNIRKSIVPEELINITCGWCSKITTKKAKDVRGNEKKGYLIHYCDRSCAGKAQRDREVKHNKELLKIAGL